ncbi:MAG: D-alanine--poly(phosphoribitol) ligase subunit 1 [Candidatus Azotimanducaceae bacterium]|jgi:D-alanine--poly(phosphoribitol) ligase subunit 1
MRDPLDLILDVARARPNAYAIWTKQASWSYQDLAIHIRAYAAVFESQNAPLVALALPQENHAYAACLGAGLAGGYYSPLNTQAPFEKLSAIISRLKPHFIVARPPLLEKLARFAPKAILVDPSSLDLTRQTNGTQTRHDWAYVNFTSGSTGTPKGVVVPRVALTNYVDWLCSIKITHNDRLSQQPNLAFDISLTDIYGALCNGATLYPVLEEQDKMMPGHFVKKHQITVWNSTPSAISQMMRGRQLNAEEFGSVRLVNFCGEALFPEQVEGVFAAVPDAVINNTYGPTEATVAITCASMTKETYAGKGGTTLPLGELLPDMEIVLMGGPSPDEGEAIIFGPQLAVGYWEDKQATDSAFTDYEGRRGYRTGDWMVRNADGLFFRERVDFQVKVRGFRIELDEVAAAIRKAGWNVAVVFKNGDTLAAVVEHQEGLNFAPRALMKRLENHIEKHAIPNKIIAVEMMPRNANDKLDRKAAQALFEARKLNRKPVI